MIEQTSAGITLSDWAAIATIVTLLGAIFTYWFDRQLKKKHENILKKELTRELRTIFIALRKDILIYIEGEKTGEMPKLLINHIYSYPISKSLYDSAKYIYLFNAGEAVASFAQTVIMLKEIERYVTSNSPKNNDPKDRKWCFENILLSLRDSLLSLAHYSFIDMRIMPAHYVGDTKAPFNADAYKQLQEVEIQIVEFIKQNTSKQFPHEVPLQYFG